MNDIYEYKSKKYKYKYLKLKKQYIGEGGADVIQDFFSNIFKGSNDLIKGSQDFIKGILPETNNNKSIGKEGGLITVDYTIKKKIEQFFTIFFKRWSTYFFSLKNNKKFITQFNDDTDVIEIITILNDHYNQLLKFRDSIQEYHYEFKDEINKSNRNYIKLNGGDMTSDVIDFFKSPGDYISSIFSNPNTESNNIYHIFNMIISQKKKIYPIKSSIEDLYFSFIKSSSNIIEFIFNKSFINQLDNNNDTEVTIIINDYYYKIIELNNFIEEYYYKFSQLKSSIEIHYIELIRLKDELYNKHNALIKDIKEYKNENIDLINNILNEKKNDISKYEKFIDYKEFIILTKDIIRTLYIKKLELFKNEYNFLNNSNFLSLDELLTTQINVNEKIKPEEIELKKIITKRIKVINKAIEEIKFLKELKNKTINDIDQEILNTIDDTYLKELLKNITDKELINKIEQKIILTSTYNMIINKNYDIQYDKNGIKWLKYNNKIVVFITEIDKLISQINKSISVINTIQFNNKLKKLGKIRDEEELDELKKILNDNLSNLLIFRDKLEEHISIFFKTEKTQL
jgi:hypothetical protein